MGPANHKNPVPCHDPSFSVDAGPPPCRLAGMFAVASRAGKEVRVKHHWRRWITPLCSLLLLGLALTLLYHLTHEWRWKDVRHALGSSSPRSLLNALLMTLVSYGCLCLYDLLAVRLAGARLPWLKVVQTSFVAYTFSNTLGFALLTGTSVRYRAYSAAGLSTGAIARIILFCSTTFFLGLAALGGMALIGGQSDWLQPLWPHWIAKLLDVAGWALLLLVAAYLIWPKRWSGRHADALPGQGARLAQLTVALLDWMAAAAVLYALLPAGSVSYPMLLSAFVLAALLGVLAHVPGGLGVFEAAMTLLLGHHIQANQLLAALLLYRIVYYLVPFTLALILLAIEELRQNRHLRSGVRYLRNLLPAFISLGTFAAGTLLLCSSVLPTLHSRIDAMLALWPLPLLELAHVLGGVSGILLLLLARGLYRRLDAAFHLAQLLLAVGMLFSLLKGDWEASLFLFVFLSIISPCRALFHRKGSLLHTPLTPANLLAIGAVLLGTLWLLLFSYRHVPYDPSLWLTFTPTASAARGLRAMGAVMAVMLMAGVAQLLSPLRQAAEPPTADELQRARSLISGDGDIHGALAQLGDKSLLFHPSGDAFLMYGCEGTSWIVMGDPIGQPHAIEELLWQFAELCDAHDVTPIIYQASPRYLPCYLELGLIPFKLGEEAIIDLNQFELSGGKLRNVRQSHSRGKRDGLSFEVIPACEVQHYLPMLRTISDAWLSKKQGREKGFSVGFFDEHYLCSNPLALVRKTDTERNESRLVGFANLWTGVSLHCLSVDLMRYHPDVDHGPIMDFLFVELLLWGKAQGYQHFNLGMAPMSGLNAPPLGSFWARLGNTLYRRGNRFYNFQGLRRYKEKYAPEWQPRYLLCSSKLALPRTLTHLIGLISRGPLALGKS
ncbi:phosphatidylglycerol lysyltransferase [Aeromonas sp. RU39B]|nr:phosphatidylglycerol lysyltransferase [Aeromonas sp. RU39B]